MRWLYLELEGLRVEKYKVPCMGSFVSAPMLSSFRESSRQPDKEGTENYLLN